MKGSARYIAAGLVLTSVGVAAFWLLRRVAPHEPAANRAEQQEAAPRRRPAAVPPGNVPTVRDDHSAPEADGWDVPCHDVALTASEVARQVVAGAPIPLNGGALLDGVYDIAGYQIYGLPEKDVLALSFQQTIVIESGGTVAKNVRVHAPGRIETTTWSVRTSGKELTVKGVCPPSVDGFSESMTYGVRGDDLLTLVEQAGRPVLMTYRRRDG